jgi:hypothetical protein
MSIRHDNLDGLLAGPLGAPGARGYSRTYGLPVKLTGGQRRLRAPAFL